MIHGVKERIPFNETSQIKYYLNKGDVIAISREKVGVRLYDHYAIYIGDGMAIHFAKVSGDIFGEDPAVVHEISLEKLVGGSRAVFIVRYPDSEKNPHEVVRIAKTFLNTAGYNLVFNNCEHFAVYCKTGVHASSQTRNAVKGAARAVVYVGLIRTVPIKILPYAIPAVGIGMAMKKLRNTEIMPTEGERQLRLTGE